MWGDDSRVPSRPRDAANRTADPQRVAAVPGEDPADRRTEIATLLEFATSRLSSDPASAESALRRAAVLGSDVLPTDRLARLHSLIVTAVAAQPGRDLDLAAAAVRAADSWQGLSVADAAHHALVAARTHYRAGRHREAAVLYRRALAHPDIPYPVAEIAILHEQFGGCLQAMHRYRAAAREFTTGARLVAADADCGELHADLLASAAAARAGATPGAALRRMTAGVRRRVRGWWSVAHGGSRPRTP